MANSLLTPRRRVLAGLGSLAGLASTTPAAATTAASSYRKLVFSLDTAPFFWWLRGTRYGLVEGELTPFWNMHVGSLMAAKDLPDGRFEVSSITASFYTDLATGQFISQFNNPFTGKTVPIFYYPPHVAKTVYAPNGQPETPFMNAPKELVSTWTLEPVWTENERVYARSDHQLRGTLNGARVRVNDLSTYIGSTRDLQNPAVTQMSAEQIFNDDNTWPGWLGMGNLPGTYFSRAFGRKVFDYADMPDVWRELMAAKHPDIAQNPAVALQ